MICKTRALVSKAGQTMVEYALLVALVSIAAIGALLIIGPRISAMFVKAANQLK